jgi:hypothetical protein
MREYGPFDRQENRERYMLRRIVAEMSAHTAGLFVVGLAHIHSLSQKLQQARFEVAVYVWFSLGAQS